MRRWAYLPICKFSADVGALVLFVLFCFLGFFAVRILDFRGVMSFLRFIRKWRPPSFFSCLHVLAHGESEESLELGRLEECYWRL